MKKNISLKGIIKFLAVITLIFFFLIEASFIHVFSFSRFSARQRKAKCIQRYSESILDVLGIRIHPNSSSSSLSGLIVSNHLSYIDVLVIASEVPALFITSNDVKESGWIGKVCSIAGCVFVNRKKIQKMKSEVDEIDEVLISGVPLVLFPEATSTNGEGVLPFKSSLFECAVRTGSPIHSFAIRYASNEKIIPYFGEMELIPHLFKLCHYQGKITAHLNRMERLLGSEIKDRKVLAKISNEMIRNEYSDHSLTLRSLYS